MVVTSHSTPSPTATAFTSHETVVDVGVGATSTSTPALPLDAALSESPAKSAVIVSDRVGDPVPEGVYVAEQSAVAPAPGASEHTLNDPDPEVLNETFPVGAESPLAG